MPAHGVKVQPQRLPWVWGGPVEMEAPDEYCRSARVRRVTRAVTTTADPATLYLWMCQLRRAPYSYDWIDNLGRRSPRWADLAMLELADGQDFMSIFTLIAHIPGESLTLQMNPGRPTRLFGAVRVKYEAVRLDAHRSQLRAALWMPPFGGLGAGQRRYLLAWGDLIMMCKQLRVLSGLAERTQHPVDTAAVRTA